MVAQASERSGAWWSDICLYIYIYMYTSSRAVKSMQQFVKSIPQAKKNIISKDIKWRYYCIQIKLYTYKYKYKLYTLNLTIQLRKLSSSDFKNIKPPPEYCRDLHNLLLHFKNTLKTEVEPNEVQLNNNGTLLEVRSECWIRNLTSIIY